MLREKQSSKDNKRHTNSQAKISLVSTRIRSSLKATPQRPAKGLVIAKQDACHFSLELRRRTAMTLPSALPPLRP
ncbi:hypothetical protein L249_6647 [Ophiocordyceps polyrhachis-furcata BCC 54312]|uniref:Uncharacterized protein n=1 Tax=Ophiocordyceps polyrhachis-furcata BCC 54312 TaxID=1330021 RepID=A0A367LJG4_9HYPO|nr:hypothetical protein L249_6647 [Ophiocordyceps polyrhachis-furcata BCC 54312]